jgi:hypothetical protein
MTMNPFFWVSAITGGLVVGSTRKARKFPGSPRLKSLTTGKRWGCSLRKDDQRATALTTAEARPEYSPVAM